MGCRSSVYQACRRHKEDGVSLQSADAKGGMIGSPEGFQILAINNHMTPVRSSASQHFQNLKRSV